MLMLVLAIRPCPGFTSLDLGFVQAEISYAVLAMATDYDCWKTDEDPVTVEAVIATLQANVIKAQNVVKATVPLIGRHTGPHPQEKAMENAIMSAKIPPATARKLAYGNLFIIFDRFSHVSQPFASPHVPSAVLCLGVHDRMLIGACNPMSCPIHVFRPLIRKYVKIPEVENPAVGLVMWATATWGLTMLLQKVL